MDETQGIHHRSFAAEREGDQGARHFDVLIVGAGLSGIGAAWHLAKSCPTKSVAILESRDTIGGTWDLFRYPGIRSDSDMHTMGYSFRPWGNEKAIADGKDILQYIRDTAVESGIDKKIRFGQRVTRASWSYADALWTIEAERVADGNPLRYTCRFLYMCSGYYDYDEGYLPDWPDLGRFKGQVIHPQKWPEDLDYAGKRVVIIGSGATAVTLVPSLSEKAAHVVMLQRSPTYIAARPARDSIADRLNRILPARMAHGIVRWKNVLYGMYIYRMAKRRPEYLKRALIGLVRQELGPDYDVEKHFTPSYNPWDQRLCLVPDSDLFQSIRTGRASVVTDQISAFTDSGIQLASGEHLEADIIITATGLKLKMLGGVEIRVEGKRIALPDLMTYKGMMFSGVPNLASAFGYTNASWTLKAELTSKYVCRLLNHMDAHGQDWCAPQLNDPEVKEEPGLPLRSGYVERAKNILPKQGSKRPWKLYQNYFLDLSLLSLGSVEDNSMKFGSANTQQKAA
jgi:monooxygenase